MGTTLSLFWSLQPGTYLDQKEKVIKYSDLSRRSLFCFQWQIFSGQYLRVQVARTYTVDIFFYDLYKIPVPQG
ncbi:hypothetical protein RHGRI_011846 [Rhododendron griersonianum]|uniref:Uncharacterized protein n=1 Tax=Rhododendron griersonianum TaxID=479676 RepID=A0AAV6KNF9_9ERIC|nr:hypothetical protein RHGRI_011846 [Rhododendron griersonianum]